jgi:transcription elongation factor SPT6
MYLFSLSFVELTRLNMRYIWPVRFKYVTEKPVRSFWREDFLKVVTGEEDNLIILEINTNIPGNDGKSSYVDEVKQWFYKDEFSSLVESWNEARGKVIELMFEQFLWPLFKKEIKRKLTAEAKEAVIIKCAQKFRNMIKVKPYEVNEENVAIDEDWDTSNGIRVMGVAYANDHSLAAFACLIDIDGEVRNILRLPALLKQRHDSRPVDKEAKVCFAGI